MHSIFHVGSPAKVNLSLFVGSRLRSTGLHTLRSVFCRAELSDSMRVEIFEGKLDTPTGILSPFLYHEFGNQKIYLSVRIIDELKRQLQQQGIFQVVENELNGPHNFIFSTLKHFFDCQKERGVCEIERTFIITLNKVIPLEAGLGGGSTNAASLLTILSKYFFINDQSLLYKVAKQTGNDVLPCLYSSPVYYDGEHILTTKKRGIALEALIIKPEEGSSTKEAFKSLNRPVQDTQEKIPSYSEDDLKNFIGVFMNFETDFYNDFEKPVFKQLPILLGGKNVLLENGASFAGLCGSGSSLIGVYRRGILDQKIINFIRVALGEGWFVKNAKIYL
jgi:4-diphosphocytidyl-2C-methyl-D-erythritol kinase